MLVVFGVNSNDHSRPHAHARSSSHTSTHARAQMHTHAPSQRKPHSHTHAQDHTHTSNRDDRSHRDESAFGHTDQQRPQQNEAADMMDNMLSFWCEATALMALPCRAISRGSRHPRLMLEVRWLRSRFRPRLGTLIPRAPLELPQPSLPRFVGFRGATNLHHRCSACETGCAPCARQRSPRASAPRVVPAPICSGGRGDVVDTRLGRHAPPPVVRSGGVSGATSSSLCGACIL